MITLNRKLFSRNTMDTVLLLTSTVNINKNKIFMFQHNKEERINAYVKSIYHWLNDTTFSIILVKNSNDKFPEIKKS